MVEYNTDFVKDSGSNPIFNNKVVIVGVTLLLIIILGGILISSIGSNVSSSQMHISNSKTSNSTYSTPVTLTAQEGITSNSLTTYNQSWLEFDGVNDYVNSGNSSTLNVNATTFSIWVDTSNITYRDLLSKWNATGNQRSYAYYIDAGSKFQFKKSSNGSDGQSVTGNITVPNNQWVNLVATYNLTQMNLYQNGILIGNLTDNLGIYFSSANLNIGQAYISNQNWYGGIDEVRIYNRSLSSTEVTEIYNSGRTQNSSLPSSGLVLWYPMNEGTGSILYDASGNLNNGN